MIGTAANQCCATKAAETGTLIEFCRDLLKEHRQVLPAQGAALIVVGDALVKLRNLMRESPRRLSPLQAQAMVDAAKCASAHRLAAGIPFSPKWHLMLHLVSRAWQWGNPAYYGTFLDESLNGRLARMAATCHRMTWHSSVVAAFRWVQKSVTRVFGR
jgi:hypothetical protein